MSWILVPEYPCRANTRAAASSSWARSGSSSGSSIATNPKNKNSSRPRQPSASGGSCRTRSQFACFARHEPPNRGVSLGVDDVDELRGEGGVADELEVVDRHAFEQRQQD